MNNRKRWPLLVIGASAGTATWSGWVGLGTLAGFGVVHPLPGIWDEATINTAITLPIGVEAYGVYALSVATSTQVMTVGARRFAWISAMFSLILGMFGQVAYHLMVSMSIQHADWRVVALVSCLPVLVLGMASVLWHFSGLSPAGASQPERVTAPERAVIVPVEDDSTETVEITQTVSRTRRATRSVPDEEYIPVAVQVVQTMRARGELGKNGNVPRELFRKHMAALGSGVGAERATRLIQMPEVINQ